MHHKSSDRQGINPLILVTISAATPAHSTSIQQFQGVSRRSPAVRAQNPPNKLEVGLAFPVHQELLAKNGIHIHENLDTAALAADGVSTFCYIMLPLLIKGATGSPGRPIALV